jgi:hypothetical protein
MKTIVGIALIAAGVTLLVFGFQAKGSFGNKITETFEGSSQTKTIWLLAGGAATTVAGGLLILLRDKKVK